jgi:hypothetical protein
VSPQVRTQSIQIWHARSPSCKHNIPVLTAIGNTRNTPEGQPTARKDISHQS